MKTIEDILVDYTDTELAYLYKYQFESYVNTTQAKIKNYIFATRKLNQNILDKLIIQNADRIMVDNGAYCPRCKTNKLRTDQVDWIIPVLKSGAEDEQAMQLEIQNGQRYQKSKTSCNVCGYILHDPNTEKKPFYKKLTDYFFDSPAWSLFRKE